MLARRLITLAPFICVVGVMPIQALGATFVNRAVVDVVGPPAHRIFPDATDFHFKVFTPLNLKDGDLAPADVFLNPADFIDRKPSGTWVSRVKPLGKGQFEVTFFPQLEKPVPIPYGGRLVVALPRATIFPVQTYEYSDFSFTFAEHPRWPVKAESYTSALSSEQPGASPGTGSTTVTIDPELITMRVQASFSSLLAPTSVAHIHCCTDVPFTGNAGVATAVPTFPGFPAGVTSGSYDQTFDMTVASSYNASFVTAQGGIPQAFDALVAGLDAGRAYLNVHTSQFPGGEIRGFPVAVIPEPKTYALMAAGLALVGLVVRRRRQH